MLFARSLVRGKARRGQPGCGGELPATAHRPGSGARRRETGARASARVIRARSRARRADHAEGRGRGRSPPQALVARIAAERPRYLEGFHISFDNWHSTDSPENVALSQDIYRRLTARRARLHAHDRAVLRPGEGDVPRRPLHQGRVPGLRHQGPVRRRVRELQQRLRADRPEEPVLDAHRRDAGAEVVRALLLQAVRSAVRRVPEGVDAGRPAADRRSRTRRGSGSRARATRRSPTGTSRAMRRTSASRSPTRRASTSTSGSTRRSAISPRSRTTSTPARRQRTASAGASRSSSPRRTPSRSISSARTSSTSTRCSGRRCSSSRARPTACRTTSTCTASSPFTGEKMSKSRGTGVEPAPVPRARDEPGVAALLHRAPS